MNSFTGHYGHTNQTKGTEMTQPTVTIEIVDVNNKVQSIVVHRAFAESLKFALVAAFINYEDDADVVPDHQDIVVGMSGRPGAG